MVEKLSKLLARAIIETKKIKKGKRDKINKNAK